MKSKGYVALVLNAHLPFVRNPDYPTFLEERWLFEALSETYLPLLRVFRSLESDVVPFKATLSISPTLCAMLGDSLLGTRYISYLDTQIALGEREVARTAGDPVFGPLASMYLELYRENRQDYVDLYSRDILGAVDYHYKRGRLELLTTAATHAFLPNFRLVPEALAAQVETALVSHRTRFGKQPAGIWLPHLGWYPGLEDLLKSYNLQYSVVTTRGALLGHPLPPHGSFEPVQCPNGFSVFVRDAAATEAVWADRTGYPADPAYRDFYRDIGFDLPAGDISPYVPGGQGSVYTGFKYWAVTGHTADKRPYDRAAAAARAVDHAKAFLDGRQEKAGAAASTQSLDRPPLMVCPYDAELFGHWWFEGPLWIEALFRNAKDRELTFVTLGEYQHLYPESQTSTPEFSSWGDGGYGEVWLDGSNDWTYRHIYKACERMTELAERFPDESGLRERILNQAAREVLLAMGSDWPLLMRTGRSSGFARERVEEAIGNFGKIYDMLSANTVATEWLTRLEKRNNVFPMLNYRMFRRKR
ncbi:MAG TPA: 1,4-alpha-glucan branching protein domain-containing protein [Rectinemataceae bacterium]|nr:1,4-alpha-glucan branching protein domain-containing protein [Rectinemataceae bacterium]